MKEKDENYYKGLKGILGSLPRDKDGNLLPMRHILSEEEKDAEAEVFGFMEDAFMPESNKCVPYGLRQQIEILNIFYRLSITLIKEIEGDKEMDAWMIKKGIVKDGSSEQVALYRKGRIDAYREFTNLFKKAFRRKEKELKEIEKFELKEYE